MPYTINHSDETKNPILVNDNTINSSDTSLKFPGRNEKGYGVAIAENFLNLLENFASPTEPDNAIEGQLWYDTSVPSSKILRIYSGSVTGWKTTGINRGGTSVRNNTSGALGDLFVDTDTNQLFLWSGTWQLISGTSSSGVKTGTVPDFIVDTTDAKQPVLLNYINDVIVSIYSIGDTQNTNKQLQPFKPKIDIVGFTNRFIYPGLNLRQDAVGNNFKLWGVAEKAENLYNAVSNETILASSIVRSDKFNTLTQPLTIKNETGLNVGSNGELQLKVVPGTGPGTGVLYHSSSSSGMELRINDSTSDIANPRTLIRLDSTTTNVGIDNINPLRKLDVNGSGRFTSTLEVNSTNDATISAGSAVTIDSTDTGSILSKGGMTLKKSLRVGNNIAVDGYIKLNAPGSTAAIIPNIPSLNVSTGVDIGSSSAKFKKIWATTFEGNFNGTLTGTYHGNADTASQLTNTVRFKISGEVEDNTGIDFNGTGSTKTFSTKISPDFITKKDLISTTDNSDTFVIYRNADSKMYKTTKATMVSDLALIPIGTVLPYAGTEAPTDFLFCDGSEVLQGKYALLFAVIDFNYGPKSQLKGFETFRLPDFRARMPLGRNGMDNGNDVVPSKANINETVSAGGGKITDPTRVNDDNIVKLGYVGGSDTVTIAQDQIPVDVSSTAGSAAYIASSATSGTKTVNTISVVNPYQTINYIIYTGKPN